MSPDHHLPWPRTGHAEMDRQHDLLHELIARVYAGIGSKSPSATRSAIAAFAEAAADHFAYEGGLMVRTSFPGAHQHLADHRAIAVGVMQLTEALDAGRPPREVMDQTLTVWQAHHVGGMDQELAKHLLAAEAKEDFGG
jgi:hemerythrin-like metal-binding protein